MEEQEGEGAEAGTRPPHPPIRGRCPGSLAAREAHAPAHGSAERISKAERASFILLDLHFVAEVQLGPHPPHHTGQARGSMTLTTPLLH